MSRILRHGCVTVASLWFGLAVALDFPSGELLAFCCLALSSLSALAFCESVEALRRLLRNKR